MKTLLLDANIIVAILFQEEERHDEAYLAAQLAANHFSIILSPATFLICNHYINSSLLFSNIRAKALVNALFCSNPAFKGGVNG